ncbi:MAG TPA: DUF1553 domain-containing protein [Gemmataceae bacterium]|nr:DUF1553 domain-containing protein [Gemmataceae bacterium]
MFRTTILALLIAAASASPSQASEQDDDSFFELKIRPVLAGTCFKCHGGKKVSHGLRVDSRAALLRGGDGGPAIVPGDPARSLLIQAIRYIHPDHKMPPDGRLPGQVTADFAAWVQRGAAWPRTASSRGWAATAQRHWAFAPVERVSPPPAAGAWSENPIDRFMLAKLRDHGLKPVGQADKRVLLRRVYFDLIGVPPTPEDMAAFLADRSPDAFAKVVDRLLASPQYGERWGRHWLDVARYADTAGDNADYPIPESRLYRDYVIDSFNADKPYDQFVHEQLAGDILAKQGPRRKYAERVVATGFLALSRRYATAPYELWSLTMEDTIETTGRAFLGLTLRCARCHDHKFDPVTKEDYYALYGFFASTQFPWTGAEEFASKQSPREHLVPLLPPDEAAPRLAEYRHRIRQLQAKIQRTEKKSLGARLLTELYRQAEANSKLVQILASRRRTADALQAEFASLRKEQEAAKARLGGELARLHGELHKLVKVGLPADLPAAYAVQEGQPVNMYVHVRGDVNERGPTVRRNVPRFLSGGSPLDIPKGSSGRLELARWLTRPNNPLTARVMVNRIWQHHFGKGIVATPSNFGVRGEPPTHLELLDWLATRFIDSGWSVKAVHRLILLSKTYQLSSNYDGANAALDPGNRWYWRYDRRRLDAEAIRDAMLAVSGKLESARPGAQPFPPIDTWGWTQHNPFKDVYPSKHRSVYLMTQRFQRHPYLALFDGPDTNTTTARRRMSTVPLQALFLMNNPFVREQAEGFARRLIGSSSEVRERVRLAHQLAWSRPALSFELEKGVRYVEDYKKKLGEAGAPGERMELEAWTSFARIMLSANEFVYLD